MGAHLIDGEFQSDKYPTCPRGKVPLSVKDKTAQDLLWEYAQRRRAVDAEFSADLETALQAAGYEPRAARSAAVVKCWTCGDRGYYWEGGLRPDAVQRRCPNCATTPPQAPRRNK
jgi:hypothetical protein